MPPALPFLGYKWRFAVGTPTESILERDVYLGCLRVLQSHEGEPASAPGVSAHLAALAKETGTQVDLARDPERNLFRNSQQYWTAFGLLESTTPAIRLSDTGRRLAEGRIALDDWVADIVLRHELPNRRIESAAVVAQWDAAHLRIRPFVAILRTLLVLPEGGLAQISGYELRRIVIAVLGDHGSESDAAARIQDYRAGRLDPEAASWPNCQPADNDRRMAREFLIFLEEFGLLRVERVRNPDQRKYSIRPERVAYVRTLLSHAPAVGPVAVVAAAVHEPVVAMPPAEGASRPPEDVAIERGRVLASVLARPNQPEFRRNVLQACGVRCVVTGTSLPEALEAAHIRAVSEGGGDGAGNGLCLRRDIHALYDAGLIRIDEAGRVHCSDAVREHYADLHDRVLDLPMVVDRAALRQRFLKT